MVNTEIEWTPIIYTALGDLLDAGKTTSTPAELAERAILMGKIDLAIDCLKQEIGNNASVMHNFDFIVTSLEEVSGNLTPDNIVTAYTLLEAYSETLRKAKGNTDLILTCLQIFEKADEKAQEEEKPSLFSEQAREDAQTIVDHATMIKESLKDRTRFDHVYAESLGKVRKFVEEHPPEDSPEE